MDVFEGLKFSIKKFDSKNSSQADYQPFNKIKIKIKKEVVPIGMKFNIKEKNKNKYIDPKYWNRFIKEKDITDPTTNFTATD